MEPPKYAHIPLILNIDGSKMSKRDKGASLMTYMEDGYAPEAVVNYLCLLGWSPKGNREKVPIAEVVSLFDLPQILRHNARFDLNKLHWLNGEYIKEMSNERFCELSVQALGFAGIQTAGYAPEYVRAAFDTCKQKVKLFSEVKTFGAFYFKDTVELTPEVIEKDFPASVKPFLVKLRENFAALGTFSADAIGASIKSTAGELSVPMGAAVHPTRLAITGSTVGPSLYHAIEVLGKDRVVARLDAAVAKIG